MYYLFILSLHPNFIITQIICIMKNQILYCGICFFFSSQQLSAQKVIYTYDDCGNTKSRVILEERGKQPNMMRGLLTQVTISPNPTEGIATVHVNGNGNATVTLRLIDMSGRCLKEESFTGSTYQLNLTGYTNGMYLIEVECSGNFLTEKIIKK